MRHSSTKAYESLLHSDYVKQISRVLDKKQYPPGHDYHVGKVGYKAGESQRFRMLILVSA